MKWQSCDRFDEADDISTNGVLAKVLKNDVRVKWVPFYKDETVEEVDLCPGIGRGKFKVGRGEINGQVQSTITMLDYTDFSTTPFYRHRGHQLVGHEVTASLKAGTPGRMAGDSRFFLAGPGRTLPSRSTNSGQAARKPLQPSTLRR